MRKYTISVALALASLVAGGLFAQGRSGKPKRSLPPQKFPDPVADVFFPDAREKLVGERPDYGNVKSQTPGTQPEDDGGDAPAPGGVFAWSKSIAPEAIEDEIKAQKLLVDEAVTTPGPFKGGGYKKCRDQFTALATMFAIAAEYDGRVRFQDQAAGLRELFARAGANCKVGTDQSYNEAKLRKQDLDDILRGEKPASIKPAESKTDWSKIDRPPLMKRMEMAHQNRLGPWLANEGEFKKNIEGVMHEAQILAALAEAITHEGFEYADDEDYVGHARQVSKSAREIVDAVKLGSYGNARTASGEISKACAACHEGYRS